MHSGDHAIYPDCREEFYVKLMKSFEIGNWNSDNIELYLPFLKFDKSEIIQDALLSSKQLKLNFNTIFKNTLTSYAPNSKGISNGKTASDIERILAFDKIGLKDPISYKESWNKVLSHAKKMENKYKNKG